MKDEKEIIKSITNDNNETGIIDRNTLSKKILDVNKVLPCYDHSVSFCPNWSPDENNIVFISAPLVLTSLEGAGFIF